MSRDTGTSCWAVEGARQSSDEVWAPSSLQPAPGANCALEECDEVYQGALGTNKTANAFICRPAEPFQNLDCVPWNPTLNGPGLAATTPLCIFSSRLV